MARCPPANQKREKTTTTRQISDRERCIPLFFGRPHNAVIRVFDEASNVIEAHEQPGEFKELELRISISTNR
jgi:hypothetical protein